MTPDENKPLRDRVAASDKICEAATDGPWLNVHGDVYLMRDLSIGGEDTSGADLRLMVHARTALPERNAEVLALLDEVERLEQLKVNQGNERGWKATVKLKDGAIAARDKTIAELQELVEVLHINREFWKKEATHHD